jgi:hypothetical protein
LLRARKPEREVLLVPSEGDVVTATTHLLRGRLEPGDLALTLGAGSITRVSYALVEALGTKSES